MSEQTERHIRVLATEACPSVSERSQLTYQLGVDEEEHLFIRINGNSGKGHFSNAWVAYEAVEALVTQTDPLASSALAGLFPGTSANTAGFVLAALKHLGVVKAIPEKLHAYRYQDAVDMEAHKATLIAAAPANGNEVEEVSGSTSTNPRHQRSGKRGGRNRKLG